MDERALAEPSNVLRAFVAMSTGKDCGECTHCQPLWIQCVAAAGDFPAQVQQYLWYIDGNWADLVTSAAERGCVRERLRLLQANQLRGKDCADRAWIYGSIGVATGSAVHWTDIQTCRA